LRLLLLLLLVVVGVLLLLLLLLLSLPPLLLLILLLLVSLRVLVAPPVLLLIESIVTFVVELLSMVLMMKVWLCGSHPSPVKRRHSANARRGPPGMASSEGTRTQGNPPMPASNTVVLHGSEDVGVVLRSSDRVALV
jgi:hypothetical protein